jgi:pimeloyl-ACP methyl ester carboxylesterase
MKKIFRITITTLLSVFSVLIILTVSLFIWLNSNSPGKTNPITDSENKVIEGSIAEVSRIEIGGIKQLVVIRSNNINNPILLMLHGGPGSPQMPVNILYNGELEKYYTVVNWDQRGSGGSYSKDIPLESINIDRMIEDTKELTKYLTERFNQKKIFLLGHSWGSYLGMRTIDKYPELYSAYIGIGQVSDQAKSEQISYQFVLDKARSENNIKAIKQLENIGFPENGIYKDMIDAMMIERNWVMYYGGAGYQMDKMDMFKMIIKPIILAKEYAFKDKINYVRGMTLTQKLLWEDLINQKLTELVKDVDVPVYILQGKHDYQTCFETAQEYFDSLQAPYKKLIVFENSAHMLPYNQEIDKFHESMIEIRNETLMELLSKNEE